MKRPTTKKQRANLYATRGLRNRTPEEVAEYLAMIAAQGAAIEARGKRIAAQFDQHRQRVDDEGNAKRFFREVGMVSLVPMIPIPEGALAEQIAAITKAFAEQKVEITITADEYLRYLQTRKEQW